MSARREEVGLQPGDVSKSWRRSAVVLLYLPAPGDDGTKARLLAETLGDSHHVEFVVMQPGMSFDEVDHGDDRQVHAWGWMAEA